jgi:hypothetical protein
MKMEDMMSDVLLLTDERPRQSIIRLPVTVPVGHKLPLGGEVGQAFNLTVEAAIRWHPDWDEPRVTVNGWRFFYHGDAAGWAGDKLVAAFGSLLPPEVLALASFHGVDMHHLGDYGREAVNRLCLAAPKAKQAQSEFVLPEQMRGRAH